jgi:hypothetical protein
VSESEKFLSRWARLKREAADTGTADDGAKHGPDDAAPEAAVELAAPVQLPTIDLSALPPIESITAATDIRAFLAPGVPADLTRAALRRAWVADPAIRDFVGIAENQWDFNDPNGIPGFGPLGPLDDVRRLLAQALGESGNSEAAAVSAVAERSPDAAANQRPLTPECSDKPATTGEIDLSTREQLISPAGPAAELQCNETVCASHQEQDAEPAEVASMRRSHGGALPK